MIFHRFIARPTVAILVAASMVGCGKSPNAQIAAPSATEARSQPAQTPSPSGRSEPTPATPDPKAPTAPSAPKKSSSPRHPSGAKELPDSRRPPDEGDIEQLIIFEGSLSLEVEKEQLRGTLHEAIDRAVDAGGYIAEQDDHSVTLRVPSGRFRETLRALEGLGEVVHRSVHAEDVTEEHHDIDVRLQSLLATRKRIESFLARAKSIDEVLRVEKELARLNVEIDRLRGRKRYLAARAAHSTITVTLRPAPEPEKKIAEEREPPPPPEPKTLELPIAWLDEVSLDGLLRFEESDR